MVVKDVVGANHGTVKLTSGEAIWVVCKFGNGLQLERPKVGINGQYVEVKKSEILELTKLTLVVKACRNNTLESYNLGGGRCEHSRLRSRPPRLPRSPALFGRAWENASLPQIC